MKIFLTSILTFISTNIDDIFILTLFFGNEKFKGRQIVIGQFVGIGLLISISLIASLIGLLIDKSYIGLLGLLPIYFGLRGIQELFTKGENTELEGVDQNGSSNIFTVAGVTFANGGDNIGVYVPLLAVMTWTDKLSMITLFFIMTALWCLLASYLTKHPFVKSLIDRYGDIVAPFVLILIGLFILKENETIKLIFK